MAITRPTGDQLRFNSSVNGEIILDAYLEAAEMGGRTLGDLMADIFDNNGDYRSDLFEFREDPANIGHFQVRVGIYTDPNLGWVTITFTNFAQYVADALSYKNDAEAAKTAAETAAATVGPITANLDDVLAVANSITSVNAVAAQLGGTVNIALTFASSNFVIDSTANKPLTMLKNFTYVFDVSDNSNAGNVLAFSSTSDGTHGGGTEFVGNVTRSGTPGSTGATVSIAINDSTPNNSFHYYCVGTSGAGAEITVKPHNIDNLSQISQDITTTATAVAPAINDVTTLAVPANLTAITDVKNDLPTIINVNTHIGDVNTTAQYIGNINVVALTVNINAINNVSTNMPAITSVNSNMSAVQSASANADDAQKYASHTINQQFTDSQGNVEYSAKHYAAQAASVGQAFTVIQGDERTSGDANDVVADGSSDTLSFAGLGGAKIRTSEANDKIFIDSRAVAMSVALG